MCGVTKGYESYPYIYFGNPKVGHLTETVCSSNCPKDSSDTLNCVPNSKFAQCSDTSIYATIGCKFLEEKINQHPSSR